MSTPGWIRGLRSLLVLAVLAGFVAILVRRDGDHLEKAYRPVRIDWTKHPPATRKY